MKACLPATNPAYWTKSLKTTDILTWFDAQLGTVITWIFPPPPLGIIQRAIVRFVGDAAGI